MTERDFDGVICIGGEDWWYHNRGHFDFQIMRRLARSMPVLFVNSIGVRMPSLGEKGLFAARIKRKLKSFTNGLKRAENAFWVFTPVSIPGAAGAAATGWALAPQIRLAALRAGIRRPVLWVHCPPGARLIGQLGEVAIVLQRTDRFEAFPEAAGTEVAAHIRRAKAAADLVVYCAPHLMAEERGTVARQLLVTHGVDLEIFAAAGRAPVDPDDMTALRRPRAGFIGGIDAHTFDPELYARVTAMLPDVEFVLVGGSSLPAEWCQRANVHKLGRKPYEQVAQYMAAMDVLLMPWNKSDWIQACNPIKLKEYLAVGRPVVTTDFPALDGWRDLVTVATDADAFAAAIRSSLATQRQDHTQRLASETWDAKAALIATTVSEVVRAKTAVAEPVGALLRA
jgi:glycosyltransferase involved in cell wall biosynthesis